MTDSTNHTPASAAQQLEYVGVISTIRGLTVEVDIVQETPDLKELLHVDGLDNVFVEVNYFRGGRALCLNLNNAQELACGQKVYRTHQYVTEIVLSYEYSAYANHGSPYQYPCTVCVVCMFVVIPKSYDCADSEPESICGMS